MNFESITEEDDDGIVHEPGAGDAIELLAMDHEDVKMLFADYEELVGDGATAEERAELARQICNALIAHTTVEEEIFYPAARDVVDPPELLDQAAAEHDSAKVLIAQILRMDPADAELDRTVMQLQDAIDHHVYEEENEVFPRVQESEIDLQSLGEQIAQRKEEVLAELDDAYQGGLAR
jgi:hemerythrin superfamily protein